MAEASHHDLFYGDVLGAVVSRCVQHLSHLLDGPGFKLYYGQEFFFSPKRPDQLWGTGFLYLD